MPQGSVSVKPFTAKRVQVESTRSFDEVFRDLQKLVGTTAHMDVVQGVSESTREQYEKVIQSKLGESGFMPFLNIDHGEWLPIFGIKRKVVRWIFGNPLIAITMIQHDINASLFTPVELLLYENESGHGSTVVYDLPSSLIAIERNPPLLAAAEELDRKVQALVSRITGVAMDQALKQMAHQH